MWSVLFTMPERSQICFTDKLLSVNKACAMALVYSVTGLPNARGAEVIDQVLHRTAID